MPKKISKVLELKQENKKNLLNKYDLDCEHPLLAVILDKDLSKKQKDLLARFLEGVGSLDLVVLIVSDQKLTPEIKLKKLPNVKVLKYTSKNREKAIGDSDMALCFDFSDVEEMLLNGTIPISIERPEVQDYNPNQEKGNCFVFREENPWSVFAAVVRATETYRFPYDWRNIVRQGLKLLEEK